MTYKIEWLEKKQTSTGKWKIDASLTGEDGAKVDGVTIWDNFPGFGELMPGATVEGVITEKQNGQYLNKTLNPRSSTTGYGSKQSMGAGMMAKKAEYIKEAQERKEESIAYFNAVNSAIALVAAIGFEGMDVHKTQHSIKIWRDWFLKEYDVYKNATDVPFP